MKRKIIILILLVILVYPFITKATDGSKEYDINQIGIKLKLNENLIDLVSNLENDTEVVQNIEDKETYLERYKQSGILLDAIDNLTETPSQEVIVSGFTNSTYANMKNLNEISDEDLNSFKEQLLNAINSQNSEQNELDNQYTVTENEILKTQNGNTYINLITKIENENINADVSIYYTVMNGRFITISFRYYDSKNVVKNDVERNTVENIEFYEIQRPIIEENETLKLAIIIAVIFISVIFIAVVIIRIKDRRLLNKNIKDINSYDQIIYLGGLYAGGVLGMSNTLKKINDITNKSIILITVGLADPQDKENKNNIRKNMEKQLDKEVFKHAKIFHLRGAIDYKNLKFTHKTMMKLLYHAVKNLPEEKKSAEDKAMIDTYNQTISFIDYSKLDPIVNEIHK